VSSINGIPYIILPNTVLKYAAVQNSSWAPADMASDGWGMFLL